MFVLLLGGNDWVNRLISTPLEWRIQAPDPIPNADAIVILGGALAPKEWPRRSIEVTEAGDRVLYGFDLFRQQKAPIILCTGGGAEPGVRDSSEAEDMRTLLKSFGVPADAILVETNSLDTLENAARSQPLIEGAGIRRILLVTSAVHMPRALEAFKRQLPAVQITLAPTDYAFTRLRKLKPKAILQSCIPNGEHLSAMDRAVHEYIGMAYYWIMSQIRREKAR